MTCTTSASRFVTVLVSAFLIVDGSMGAEWPEKGNFRFADWAGPAINVYYSIPPTADAQTPILVVVPGALRNAADYRNSWHHLALANEFIVLTIEGELTNFPTEFDYNAGGVVTPAGEAVPEQLWTYSVIEPLFDDFKRRFGSQREKYSIFGHSAGGQFVHTFLLFKPNARVQRAVAANPAFCMMLDPNLPYPFGLKGAPLPENAVKRWMASPTVLLLADRDLSDRSKPLSNGPLARAQGPHVFARGLGFYRSALIAAREREVPLAWKLEVVQDVGHAQDHMASYAVKYLFRD